MKACTAILISVLFAVSGFAQSFVFRNPGLISMLGGTTDGGGEPPAGPSYLMEIGFDGSIESGFADTGTPTWGYTTIPAPLVGSGSFYSAALSSYTTAHEYFAETDEVWMFIRVHPLTGTPYAIQAWGSAGASVGYVQLRSSGVVRLNMGSSLDSGTGEWTTGVSYYIWVRFKKGTGADAEADVWISSSSAKPGSPLLSITTGTRTYGTKGVRIGVLASSSSAIYDRLLIDDEPIEDNP